MKSRLVIKVGSAVLTTSEGINRERMKGLVGLIAQLHEHYDILLVSSGAVATGHTIVPAISNKSTAGKQALAAIGQAEVINNYKKKFEEYRIPVAQILLTADDFDSFKRSENAKNAIDTLLSNGVVPIINENDSVVVDEILRGDNDQLSAQVAYYFGAEMLVILSDIKGYYDKDPNRYSDAKMLACVDYLEPEILEQDVSPNFSFATGGIVTKLKAANFLMTHGKKMFLASGFDLSSVKSFLLEGIQKEGTLFVPKKTMEE